MFWAGLFLGLILAVAIFCGIALFILKRITIRSLSQAKKVVQKLCDYGEMCDVVILEEDDENFAQFRKYVTEDGDWGVDFVFPLVGENVRDVESLKLAARNLDLPIVEKSTPFGWSFLFFQVSRNGSVLSEAVEACFSASAIRFDKPLGFGRGSTLDITKRTKVFGEVDSKCDWGDRYDVTLDE